jgi:hypothetical protein
MEILLHSMYDITHKWENNIKIGYQRNRLEKEDRINLAMDMNPKRLFWKTAVNPCFSEPFARSLANELFVGLTRR